MSIKDITLPTTQETELALFRTNSNEEKDRGITNYVVCRECGGHYHRLANKKHLFKHGLNIEQYHIKWPGAPTSSVELKESAATRARDKRASQPRKPYSSVRRSENSKKSSLAFWAKRAKEDVEDLALFQANPNEEIARGITEYVVCRECGVHVHRLDRACSHLRVKHDGMTTKQYQAKWPGAPTVSVERRQKNLEQCAGWRSKPVNREKIKAGTAVQRDKIKSKLAEVDDLRAQRDGLRLELVDVDKKLATAEAKAAKWAGVGRDAEDPVWACVDALVEQGLRWKNIKYLADVKFGYKRSIKAYQEGRRRYLERQGKPTK